MICIANVGTVSMGETWLGPLLFARSCQGLGFYMQGQPALERSAGMFSQRQECISDSTGISVVPGGIQPAAITAIAKHTM